VHGQNIEEEGAPLAVLLFFIFRPEIGDPDPILP
jgi:hypothetical protein